MAVDAGNGLGVLGEELDELEVEILAFLASFAAVPLVVQNGLVDGCCAVIELLGNQVVGIGLLEVWVDLHVPGHNPEGCGRVIEPHGPLRKPPPDFLMLRQRQIPERPVVHLSRFGNHLLLL